MGQYIISPKPLIGSEDDDTLSSFSRLSDYYYKAIFGEEGDDVITGGELNDELHGGDDVIAGNDDDDLLFGGGDDDELFGDNGNDVLAGGAGWDFLAGGEGSDRLNARGRRSPHLRKQLHSGLRRAAWRFLAGRFL